MRLPWLLLVVVAGVVGSALYDQGVPSWLVYVARQLIYHAGS